MIDKTIFNKIIKKFGLNIELNSIIEESLTHSSYANEHGLKSNERLEFLGFVLHVTYMKITLICQKGK